MERVALIGDRRVMSYPPPRGFRIAMIFREDAERLGWLVQWQFVTRHLCISVPRRGSSRHASGF